eukprot:4096459-Amphidinium_carterae.2
MSREDRDWLLQYTTRSWHDVKGFNLGKDYERCCKIKQTLGESESFGHWTSRIRLGSELILCDRSFPTNLDELEVTVICEFKFILSKI